MNDLALFSPPPLSTPPHSIAAGAACSGVGGHEAGDIEPEWWQTAPGPCEEVLITGEALQTTSSPQAPSAAQGSKGSTIAPSQATGDAADCVWTPGPGTTWASWGFWGVTAWV